MLVFSDHYGLCTIYIYKQINIYYRERRANKSFVNSLAWNGILKGDISLEQGLGDSVPELLYHVIAKKSTARSGITDFFIFGAKTAARASRLYHVITQKSTARSGITGFFIFGAKMAARASRLYHKNTSRQYQNTQENKGRSSGPSFDIILF